MTFKTTKLRDAITFALAVGLSGPGLAFAQDAAAQQTTPTAESQEATELDTIVVTGTRIKSQTLTASSPVTEINAEQFNLTGASKVEDLVNQYPQLDLNFDSFMNNGATGYATASLRGMGAERTLTLVNGRRLPAGTNETTDLSIIPAAAVKRVDVLTGGASAVYGADAVAGVVNFILDDEFEGMNVNFGWSAYQHDNDNKYMQNLQDEAGYPYETGNSGFDGVSKNVDVVVGTAFGAEDRGHAMGWLTWRENKALLQGQRDYASCALGHGFDEDGNVYEYCGGSATADPANFLVNGGFYRANGDGSFSPGINIYNYAPINYYQRPDERVTAGFSARYEVNEHFIPYVEFMMLDRESSVQIAESGTFGAALTLPCDTDYLGSLCADTGTTTDDVTVRLYKRNVEGGPRFTRQNTQTNRTVLGARGALAGTWTYDVSLGYGFNRTKFVGTNDFLFSRIFDAAQGCPAGSFEGCIPYDIWTDSITPEAAAAMSEDSWQIVGTTSKSFQAFATGELGFGLPSADGENIGLVVGTEWRENTYSRESDPNSLAGNFAGAGGAATDILESIDVKELFMEAAIPLVVDAGPLDRLGAELGYRYSDYSTSGGVSTYKVGLSAQFAEDYLFRASWNRAIRAPGLTDLYTPATLGLWAGSDPCAGPSPTATQAQCELTGVPASEYGSVPVSPAGQYNGFFGGNTALEPEEANTFTVGFAASPISNLNLAVDYYRIKVEDAILTLQPETILNACLTAGALCERIIRDPTNHYDLWVGNTTDPNPGRVLSQVANNGIFEREGIDLNASYAFDLGPGRLSAAFVGTHTLKDYNEPVPGLKEVSYDCAGIISESCRTPEWRHVFTTRYAFDRYSVGLRWRHIGEMDFEDELTGEPGDVGTDPYLGASGKMKAFNYLDLSGTVDFDFGTWTIGVNNVADKEPPLVGNNLTENANSLNGYDQGGRFVFTSFTIKLQ